MERIVRFNQVSFSIALKNISEKNPLNIGAGESQDTAQIWHEVESIQHHRYGGKNFNATITIKPVNCKNIVDCY